MDRRTFIAALASVAVLPKLPEFPAPAPPVLQLGWLESVPDLRAQVYDVNRILVGRPVVVDDAEALTFRDLGTRTVAGVCLFDGDTPLVSFDFALFMAVTPGDELTVSEYGGLHTA